MSDIAITARQLAASYRCAGDPVALSELRQTLVVIVACWFEIDLESLR